MNLPVNLCEPVLEVGGIIRYARGQVDILDLQGLEAGACECFRVVKDEYDRLLGEKRRGDR